MKITLACIVGNEEAVIERFIRSFAPAVDAFVFVRAIGTQEPDSTINLTVDICDELGKDWDNRFYNEGSFPHVDNFGQARQMAWDLAMQSRGDGVTPDFLIWADADDVLAPGAAEAIRDAAEKFDAEVFIMPYYVKGDKQIVMRERMVKSRIGSKWNHAIHEQLTFPKDVTYRIIADAGFIHSPTPGRTGSHERNVAILTNELRDTARNLFYLSQEYFQSHQTRKFIRTAKSALTFSSLGDLERYEILLNLAQTEGQPSKDLAAEAFALMPDRREALALLCNYALIDGDHEKALQLSEVMLDIQKPTKSYWSQNNEWYGWKAAELHRQCLRLNGQIATADFWFTELQDSGRHVFSIVHATLARPEKALAIREMWLSRATCPQNVDYVFGLHHDDAKSREILGGFKHTVTDQKGAGWNYDTAAGAAVGTIIVQAQDDCYPPQGWDDMLLEIVATPFHPVFVACNDGHRPDRLSVNSIMTRAYMDIKAARDPGENGFFHRGYVTMYPDTENSFRALQDAKAGICQYRDARNFVIYHDHPLFNPGIPIDATYRWENSPENYQSGEKLFAERNPTATADCMEREPERKLEEALA